MPKILLSSLSSKIALYDSVLRQVKMFSPNASVICSDSNPNCPGAVYVKYFRTLPRLNNLSNEELLGNLSNWGVTHVLPTSDDELEFWAQKAPILLSHEVKILTSSLDAIKLCKDKLSFPKKITVSDFKQIPSLLSPDESNYPKWVVKERFGSGSRGLSLNVTRDEAVKHASRLKEAIFQPFIIGKEFTAEGWVNKNGKCPAVLLRWRDKVLNGESHISTTFKNSDWEAKIKSLFNSVNGLKGHCIGQFIVDRYDYLHLVEINARLGGASPLSLSAGLNSIFWSLSEEKSNRFLTPDFQPMHGAKLTKLNGQVFISYKN